MSASARPLDATREGWLEFALRRDNRTLLLHIAFALFAAFTLFMAFWHSPWRDEAQPWLFTQRLDLRGLFYITRHHGHPMIWFLCLKALQSIGLDYRGMEVLNWTFCLLGVWMLFYRSALPLMMRLGVAFAPICFLEIAWTARNYAMVMPLIFLAAMLHRTVRDKPVRFCLILALVASTNVFAAGVFVGIACQFLLEQARDSSTGRYSLQPLFTRYLIANLVLAAGALFLVLQMAPVRFPGDPFPDVASHLTPGLDHFARPFMVVIALVYLAMPFLRASPRTLGTLPTLALIAIPVFAYGTSGRHVFMLVLGLVYYAWIYFDAYVAGGAFFGIRLSELQVKLLVVLLVVPPAWSCKRKVDVLTHPNMDGANAAHAIIARGLDRPDTLLVATDSFRPMSLFLFLKNVSEYDVPPEFGPSPQHYALDAYLPAFAASHNDAENMKLQVLELAHAHPEKTVVLVVCGPGALSENAVSDPGYPLLPVYASPPLPQDDPLIDERYRIYVLKR